MLSCIETSGGNFDGNFFTVDQSMVGIFAEIEASTKPRIPYYEAGIQAGRDNLTNVKYTYIEIQFCLPLLNERRPSLTTLYKVL